MGATRVFLSRTPADSLLYCLYTCHSFFCPSACFWFYLSLSLAYPFIVVSVSQEAARYRDEQLLRQKHRRQAEEDGRCTFRPAITARCPELVRRTAAGMRCVREFRRKEALESGEAPAPARPTWRYS